MPTHKLRIWKTLGTALMAPFSLEAASWKALAKSGLALVIASLLPITVSYFRLNGTVQLMAFLPVWIAVAWFALDYQRHLLMGSAASESGPRPWHRYGLYLLAMGLVCGTLAVLGGMLLYLVLPAMVWFMMALNSPSPWLASGTVVMWILVVGLAAYPSVRLALILPAMAVEHEVAPKRIWRLSQHNGLRLLVLLILIPGLLNGALYFAFEADPDSVWLMIFAGILDTYLAVVYLSILSFAYRDLSDQQLPTAIRTTLEGNRFINARRLRTMLVVALVFLISMGVWDALYRVAPGEQAVISRLGKRERVESEPGVKLKIPLIEDTQIISKQEIHRTESTARFLTMTKTTLSLNYDTHWRVADADIFARASAGRSRLVNNRIDQLLTDELRSRVAKLSSKDVQRLLKMGGEEFKIDEPPHRNALFDGVLERINSKGMEFGIEVTEWKLEIDHRPGSE